MEIFAINVLLLLMLQLINALDQINENSSDTDEDVKYVYINGTRLDFLYWNSDLGNDKPIQITFGNESSILKYWIKDLPLKVITHGWLASDNNSTGVFVIKTAYVDTGGYNIITVDWSSIGNDIIYSIPARSTASVGAKIAEFLDNVVKVTNLRASDIHLIGHSLGAHVSGSCGSNFKSGKIGRITALDPAAPGFEYFSFNTKPLSSADAEYVDVIHTAAGSYGYMENLGHGDFFPNSGFAPQPGCISLIKMLDFISCSHSRAHELYTDSVYHKKSLIAVKCSTWSSFKDGKCENETRVFLGHDASPW
uniref:Lipase member H-B n=1 Tax=Sipha flava TaxID=143950 RepID=A0A2S2QF13_9HEMI